MHETKRKGITCETNNENGHCKHLCTDVTNGYYCHCRDGFQPNPDDPYDCIDIDECMGNNTCTQSCLNTKGSYLCRCLEDYENNVVVGAMTGKDCRAKGDPPLIMIAADGEVVQLSLAHAGETNRHAVDTLDQNDIIAVDFDPRRELMFWIDRQQRKIYRSALPKGNQSHAGQELNIDFKNLKSSPSALSIDYLTGNIYLAVIADEEAAGFIARKKRHTEQSENENGRGTIYLALSDGRYLRTVIKGRLQIPTAVITLPQIGRICFADAGFEAKIECADMDGKHRDVCTKRTTVIMDNRMPWAIDVFENNLYWASKESRDLYVQDKFGRGRISVLASNIPNAHNIRVYQRFARDTSRAVSACSQAVCSHLCAELPLNTYTCLCPDESPQLDLKIVEISHVEKNLCPFSWGRHGKYEDFENYFV
ncbi:unnamed protein product [Onchocerca flexuosa]|uniref:EGF-like domain protein n=1 Tax=Onchocerca flexuosa TaxID=387005 RepID=A0A183I3V8_9BILA|nr:unnamed protein product [Onchocerca flexuosa]